MDVCSNVIAVMEVSRITYSIGPSQLYIDSVMLGKSEFYVVGGFIPDPTIPEEDSDAILRALANDQPRYCFAFITTNTLICCPRPASSKIVEYFRTTMDDFPPNIQALLKEKLPRLKEEGMHHSNLITAYSFYSPQVLHNEPYPHEFRTSWHSRVSFVLFVFYFI
jgi:hypothetical protein